MAFQRKKPAAIGVNPALMPSRPANGKTWTVADDERLLQMRSAGKAYSVIAKDLGRTQMATETRAQTLKRRARTVNQT